MLVQEKSELQIAYNRKPTSHVRGKPSLRLVPVRNLPVLNAAAWSVARIIQAFEVCR